MNHEQNDKLNRFELIIKTKQGKSAGKLYNTQEDPHSLSKRIDTSPGPAAYRIKSIFEIKSGYSMPSSRKDQKRLQKPDPWTYYPQDLYTKPRSPKAIITKGSRIGKQKQGPSPSHYQTNYNVVFHSVRKPVFGKQKRVQSHASVGPGPANYNIERAYSLSAFHRFAKIGTEKRQYLDKNKCDLPAPNNYQKPTDLDEGIKKKRGYSIGQRLRCRTQTNFPKDYFRYNNDKQIIMKNAPAFTFKKSTKKQEADGASPGPAAYYTVQHQQRGAVIGKSMRRLHSVSAFPGPQAYTPSPKHQTPSYSIPRAVTKEQRQYTPGPGKYSPQLPQNQKYKQISIGFGDRNGPFKIQQIPGPGQYNIASPSLKNHSVTRGKKNFPSIRNNASPMRTLFDPLPSNKQCDMSKKA